MQYLRAMFQWSQQSFGRFFRLLAFLSVLTGTVSGCSGINPLGFLKTGTNVAANTQVGATNHQTLGASQTNSHRLTIRPKARVGSIDQSIKEDSVTVDKTEQLTVNYNIPISWFMLVLGVLLLTVIAAVVGWMLPQPWVLLRKKT